jgi:hypothetical protein
MMQFGVSNNLGGGKNVIKLWVSKNVIIFYSANQSLANPSQLFQVFFFCFWTMTDINFAAVAAFAYSSNDAGDENEDFTASSKEEHKA